MSLNRSTGPTQDLSFADQQELLAFIDKRNWFEGKLEVRSHAKHHQASVREDHLSH